VSHLHSRLGGADDVGRAATPPPGVTAPGIPLEAPRVAESEVVTIRCRAEVTQLHAANLVADIADAATRARVVVVDLHRTARIDAVGLGALVAGARSCRDAGSALHVVGAHGMVGRALRFTGLARALSPHATAGDPRPDAAVPRTEDDQAP
jgi:anti-anti-sigma factor